MKRVLLAVLVILCVAVCYWGSHRSERQIEVRPVVSGLAAPHHSPPEDNTPEPLNLAAALNAPESSVQRDLQILGQVFSVWQTNFLRTGNPVGENIEITAALLGNNSLKLAFIQRNNRVVNDRGELIDRWGTPFFFHQLSGTRMEIRSAGPDRLRGTADDAVFTP